MEWDAWWKFGPFFAAIQFGWIMLSILGPRVLKRAQGLQGV
jgi:hypothetical protein